MFHLKAMTFLSAWSLLVGGAAFALMQVPQPENQTNMPRSATAMGTDGGMGSAIHPPSVDSTPAHPTMGSTPSKPTTAADAARRGLATHEQRAITKLHYVNAMEIETGTLAKEKAQSPDVKAFAEKLIEDHKKAESDLALFAEENSIDLAKAPSDQDRAKDMKVMDELKRLNGDAFDRRFLAAMVEGHNKTIRLVTQARQNTSNPKLTSLLDNVLPTLKKHRDMAMKLQHGKGTARRMAQRR